MILSVVISLIPVFILVFIVLHFSTESVWTYFISNEASGGNNRGLSTTGNEGKREDSSLRGYCDDFQDSLNLQNQRHEIEALQSNDFETPTHRNLNSRSAFSQQDEAIESTDFTSEEVSSTKGGTLQKVLYKKWYTNSQLVSNQEEDGKKVNAVPCSDILNRNPKVINRNKSLLETIQPDEMINNPFSSKKHLIHSKPMITKSVLTPSSNKSLLETIQPDELKNESLPSRDITNEHLISSKPMIAKSVLTSSSKNENEIFPSEIHCWNLEECWSNTKLVTKQQNDGKEDKTHEFPDTHVLNKNSKKCSEVSELLSKQMVVEREDKEHPSKDVRKRIIEGHLNYSQTVSRLQDSIKDHINALESKVNRNKNLEGSCSNNQIQSKQQNKATENKSLLSKDVQNKNVGGYLNTSQTVSTPRDLEKDKSLQSQDILSKNLEVICCNSQLLAQQQDDRKEDKKLPSKIIPKANIERLEQDIPNLLRRSNSQTVSREQDHKIDTALQSIDIQNKNLQGSCPNHLSQSKQQYDGKEDKALPSENIQKTNIEEHLITSQICLAPQDNEKDKALQSKEIQNKNLQESCPNHMSQPKQQDDETLDKSLPSKNVQNENTEEYLNKTETVPNQNSGGMKEKYLPSKRTRNRNPNRYFFNSGLVSKQQKKKMKRRIFTSKIRDNPPKGVGSFMCVLFEKQLYTDVTFVSRGNREALLSAHRAVLAARCEHFKELLFGERAEESDGMQMDIEIHEVPFRIFSSIVKWFYTGNVEFSDDDTVLQIYKAAKLYKIQQLIDECRNYIESMEITEHNVCSTLQLCNTVQVNELKRRCVRYIEQNTLSVINSKAFEKSPFNIVREICQLQCLSLKSEAELLEAVLRWLSAAQPKLKRSAVKELERALLKCVRFLSFGAKEFSDVIAKNATLLTAEESLNILLYLNNPTPDGLEALPKWCNRSQRTLLSHRERKDSGIEKNLPSEDSGEGRIKVELKPAPDVVQDLSELTSVLHMRCKKGVHRITSVKCSLQAAEENGGCVLADLKIIVNVMPNGPKFLKFYSIRQREVRFDFPRAVPVHEGQVLMMEVTAKASPSSKFLQFDKWLNDPKSYFDCFFISKPVEGRFYFISEVVYEPLAPRLNSPH